MGAFRVAAIATGILIGTLAVAFVINFASTGSDLAVYRFWAPKQENAKTQVFHQAQGYIDGKQEYISRLRLEYERATDSTTRAALKEEILSEASTVDVSQLSPDLQTFISGLRGSI